MLLVSLPFEHSDSPHPPHITVALMVLAAEASTTTVFGYLIGGSLHQQTIAEAELFIAAAVTSIGATRQTKSHLKASLGVGNSIKAVETMIAVAGQVADWNHSARPETFDVQKLAKEVEENLAPENHQ